MQRTADRAARAAGSVYRVVAGTQNLDTAIKTINSDTDTLNPIDDEQLDAEGSDRTSRTADSGQISLVKHTQKIHKQNFSLQKL